MTSPDFQEFPKMARWSRDIIVTEKIDGTNACVYIGEDGTMLFGSRTRWITPENDNAGFARWATEHAEELRMLGPGRHFGEWWGQGIQRNYGLQEKRFSLFNVSRWRDASMRPLCCGVVPILYEGPNDPRVIDQQLGFMRAHGSVAAPGFKNAEGIVIWHTAANIGFKKTLLKDEMPKSLAGEHHG